jgi:hypothetical protein
MADQAQLLPGTLDLLILRTVSLGPRFQIKMLRLTTRSCLSFCHSRRESAFGLSAIQFAAAIASDLAAQPEEV